MALQAENPNSLMGIWSNRSSQFVYMDGAVPGFDPRLIFPHPSLDPNQDRKVLGDGRISQPGAATGAPIANTTASKKKRKAATQLHKPVASGLPPIDLNQTHGPAAAGSLPPRVVSTGLCLAFEDDWSTVTSSRVDGNCSSIHDDLAALLLKQQEDMKQLLNAQTEQLQRTLLEQTQKQSKALVVSLENEVSRRFREKEVEIGRISGHNTELEHRVKHLTLETQFWQSKAKTYEAMTVVLRANLQQALVMQSREPSKLEGCGDSEAEDEASVYIDERSQVWQRKSTTMPTAQKSSASAEPLRVCKRCRSREVTILLLPCLHLCLCRDCLIHIDRCPACQTPKSTFVEVYLS